MDGQRKLTTVADSAVDPVTLEIIRGGLRSVQSEMEVLISGIPSF